MAAEPSAPTAAPSRLLPWVWLLPCLLALLAYRSVTHFAFAADARTLILDNLFIRDRGLWDQLTHDYFWSSSGSIIPYWRPLTKMSWWYEWRLFGPNAGDFVWVSVLWHAIGVAGIYRLARDLRTDLAGAVIVSVAYALHPVAIEPVGMIMARSDVVAAAGSLWSIVAWRRWVRGDSHPRAWLALHIAATLVALGSKEVASTLPIALIAFAWVDDRPQITPRQRAITILPSIALAVVYLAVRHHILTAEHPDLARTSLDLRPVRPWASIALYLPSTFPFAWTSAVRDLPVAEAKSGGFLVYSVVVWGGLIAAVVHALRRDRVSLPLLVWMLAALAPVILTRTIYVPVGPDKLPLSDRWLYAALAPAILAWWRVIEPFLREGDRRRAAIVATSVWSMWMLVRSTPDRARFTSELTMLDDEDRTFTATPERFRTTEDRCRFEERKVVRALAHNDAAEAYRLAEGELVACERSPEALADLLDACVHTQRFAEAEPLADALIATPPRDPRSNGRLTLDIGLAFLGRGRGADGEKWLARSIQLGTSPCTLPWVAMAESTRARGDIEGAASRLEHAYECGGRSDPSLLIAAATWLVDARNHERAQTLLGIASRHTLTQDQVQQVQLLTRALAQKR